MRVVAFVPAKGTSERVPGKNLRMLGDKPLFLHMVDTLLKCRLIDDIYVHTEAESIKKLVGSREEYIEHAVQILDEPTDMANNNVNGNQILLWAAEQVKADIYIQALPTAPFLLPGSIDRAIRLTKESWHAVVATISRPIYRWERWADGTGGRSRYDDYNIPNAKDMEPYVGETMGLYVIRREELFSSRKRVGHHPYLMDVSDIEAIDIDTEEDFRFAETVWKGLHL